MRTGELEVYLRLLVYNLVFVIPHNLYLFSHLIFHCSDGDYQTLLTAHVLHTFSFRDNSHSRFYLSFLYIFLRGPFLTLSGIRSSNRGLSPEFALWESSLVRVWKAARDVCLCA